MPKNTHLEMRPMADVDLNREGVVAYSSTNNATHVSFTATSAPNSRYAAQLAEIALAVQQNGGRRAHHHPKKNKRLEFWPRKTSSPLPPPRALPAPAPALVTASDTAALAAVSQPVNATAAQPACHCWPHCTEQDGYDDDGSVVESAAYADSSSYAASAMPGQWPRESARRRVEPRAHAAAAAGVVVSEPVTASAPVATSSSRIAAAAAPPEVTRHRTGWRTTYKAKSREGKIQVSAPAGTNEERLFDAIVDANSVPRASREQRASRRIDRDPARRLIQEAE